MDLERYLENIARKKPSESKKWMMAIIGVSCVMTTFFTGLIACILKPEISSHVANLSMIVVTFMGALVGAYTTGQSFVDWKAQTTIESLSHYNREEKLIDIKYVEQHMDTQSRAKEEDYEN